MPETPTHIAAGPSTNLMIANYSQRVKDDMAARGLVSREDEIQPCSPMLPVPRPVGPAPPHIVQAMRQDGLAQKDESQQESSQKQPARHTSVSRGSEASGASVRSKHSIFSTPGRDEMERKKPIVEEDEGPFAKATSMQDLEERRRKVSEATRTEDEEREKRMVCGLKCVVM